MASFRLVFNVLALGLALILAFSLSVSSASQDLLLRHLAMGRVIANQEALPQEDPFSFAQAQSPQHDTNGWLFSLACYAFNQFAGIKGLQVLRSFLLFGLFFLLLALGFRRGARPFSSAACALAVLASLHGLDNLAPMLLGLFFFSLALWIMEGEFWPAFFGRWIFLPLLLVLWVNMQAGAIYFPLFATLWAWAERQSPSAERPNFVLVALAGTLAVLFAASFLNPDLGSLWWRAWPGAIDSPLEAGALGPSLPSLSFLALAALALFAALPLPQGGEHGGRDLLLFLVLALGSLLWKSLLPFAALYAAPLTAARGDQVVDALPTALRGARWLIKFLLLGLGLLWAPRVLASAARSRPAAQHPKESIDFFDDQMLSGNIFCDDSWSGELIWRLAPSIKVYCDEEQEDASYRQIMSLGDGWEEELRKLPADFLWLKIDSALAKELGHSASWQPICFDDASVLYAAVNSEHAEIIKAWAPRGLLPGDLEKPFDLSRLPQAEADLETRRLKWPKLGILHFMEARYWLVKGESKTAEDWLGQGIQADPLFAPNFHLLAALKLRDGERALSERLETHAESLEAP